MQQRLPLFPSALQLTRRTVLPDLRNVPPHRAPTFDLSLVVRTAPAHVIPAIPLKPATRIFVIDPPFLLPVRQRFRGVDAEVVQLRIVPLATELRTPEPRRRKLSGAVSHVLPAEDSEFEHLARCQFGFEFRMKVFTGGFSAEVNVVRLHQVVDGDAAFLHQRQLKQNPHASRQPRS